MNFRDAVEPANKTINLLRPYPIEFISELPNSQLQQLTTSADSFYQLLTRIQEFDATQTDSYNARTQLIENIKGQYQTYFDQLHQLISYGSSRQRDFGAMEREARASMQRAKDDADALMKTLSAQQEDAKRILDEVRKVAAEQGVSQQASYFAEESKNHETQANQWRSGLFGLRLVLESMP